MAKGGEDRWFNPKHGLAPDPDQKRFEKRYDSAGKLIPTTAHQYKSKYMDYSDAKALIDKQIIDFYDKTTGQSIAFKAFITDYQETYESVWSDTEDLQGADYKIRQFVRTSRRITLAWKTVAASLAEAKENMRRASDLIRMGYGKKGYDHSTSGRNKGMVAKVRFANWIVKPDSLPGNGNGPTGFAPAKITGLRCQIDNIQYSPDLDQGTFDTQSGVFPKVINLSCMLIPNETISHKKFKNFPFGYSRGGFRHAGFAPEDVDFNNDKDLDDPNSRAQEFLMVGGEKIDL